MNREQEPSRIDTPREPVSSPTLARVRPRGESHLLALVTAAAFVFVAIAIAKPWSGPPSGPAVATPSPAAEIAEASTAGTPPPGPAVATPSPAAVPPQPDLIVVQPGEVPTTGTAACPESSPVSPLAERSPGHSNLSAQGIGPITGPRLGTVVVVCPGANVVGPGELFQ